MNQKRKTNQKPLTASQIQYRREYFAFAEYRKQFKPGEFIDNTNSFYEEKANFITNDKLPF